MKVSDAMTKVCPFMSGEQKINCICDPCMFWVTTVSGKKEIHRTKMPYDIYPYEEGRRHRSLIEDGYEEVKLNDEFRSTYIKYEEAHEGYCARIGK